jgi:hypothetical protein
MKPASPPAVLRVTLPSGARPQPLPRPAPAAPGLMGPGRMAPGEPALPDPRGNGLPRASVLRHHGASGQLALELRRR